MTVAVALVCDLAYLVPTVGTALAARAQIADRSVRIFVFVADLDAALGERLARVLAARGVTLRAAALPGLRAMEVGPKFDTHVTVATMARLWLDELLPTDVSRFLYIDGDVDITGPLDPLLALQVPPGGLLAAPDCNLLVEGEFGQRSRVARGYLAGLGLTRGADYFNSGVMLVDRAGWGAICAEARAFHRAHPERCPFQDQSALNAAVRGRHGELSLLWNWQTDFLAVMDPRRIGLSPATWHFTGFPKPWQATFPPWGEAFGRSFALGVEALAPLGIAPPRDDPAAVAAGVRRYQEAASRLRKVYPWRLVTRRHRILAQLRRTEPARGGRPTPSRAAAPGPVQPTTVEEVARADR
jgi:lipopolysaccharide biosynthesis glycosyltransferase